MPGHKSLLEDTGNIDGGWISKSVILPCDVSWVHKRLGFDLVSCYLLIHVNFLEFTYLELYFLWSKSMKESSSFVSIVGLAVSQLNGHQQNTKLIAKVLERFTCKYIQRFILSKSKQIQSYIRTKQNTSIINIHLQTETFITFGFCFFTTDFLRVTITLIVMYFLFV